MRACDQAQTRNLRWRGDPNWRSPVTGAAARVDPQVVQLLESGYKRLLQTHEEIPRQELPAVRMSGQLQREARLRCFRRTTRLVGQQQAEPDVDGCAKHGFGRVAAMRGVEAPRAVVGHAGHDRARAIMLHHNMLVHQYGQSEPTKFGDPLVRARIVFVVPSDQERTMARRQSPKRTRMRGELGHRAIHDVTGHGDQVRLERVDGVDDLFPVTALDRRADVNVADLYDREA